MCGSAQCRCSSASFELSLSLGGRRRPSSSPLSAVSPESALTRKSNPLSGSKQRPTPLDSTVARVHTSKFIVKVNVKVTVNDSTVYVRQSPSMVRLLHCGATALEKTALHYRAHHEIVWRGLDAMLSPTIRVYVTCMYTCCCSR